MSNYEKDFERLDQTGRPEDKVARFKRQTGDDIAYRNAWGALAARDPKAVEGLTHPDQAGEGFDYAKAMEALREAEAGGVTRLRADPAREVRAQV